jgi:CRISPR-associated Csx2 family protein
MTHTLISFLGKARKDNGGNYQVANYDFDGTLKSSQFFGLALADTIKPDQLVILGTSGSMWDVFFERMAENTQQDNQLFALIEAVSTDSVTQIMLDGCREAVSNRLGVNCQLKLIPYGADQNGQIEILKIMANDIVANSQVSLDLTHGLRHLPMLGLLSAMYLKSARNVEIAGIYYGALDRTNNDETPVMRLDGLLTIADWINALNGFDKTGDIAPFADLLSQEGVSDKSATSLKTAAFHESILNINDARKPLKTFRDAINEKELSGIASLFKDSLLQRISWIDQQQLYKRQQDKAMFYLNQRDYVRAAMLGYEAIITYKIQNNNPAAPTENFGVRDDAKKDIEYELRHYHPQKWESYKLLRGIRNTLAHTVRPDTQKIQQALSSENNLREELKRVLTELFSNE